MRAFPLSGTARDIHDPAWGCRPMVVRTYRELLERGHSVGHALDAAREVLLWHHPEMTRADAGAAVMIWTDPAGAH